MRVLFWIGLFTLSLSAVVWAAPVPLLRVEEPTDGQIIESYVVNLKFSLKNFTLKDYRTSAKNSPNQGHFLIWLDQEERKKETATKYYRESPYLMADVLPGKHTLSLELVNNDGTSFDPKISQTIKFETKAPAGSEASPVTKSDGPKVTESPTGVAPKPSEAGSWPALRYLLVAATLFLFGVVGLKVLKSGQENKPL